MARGQRMRMQDILGVGQGDPEVAYDQTDPQAIMAGAEQAGAQQPIDPYQGANVAPTMGMEGPTDPAGMAEGMGAAPEDLSAGTDMLSDQELAMAEDPGAPDMEQIMSDPTLPPEQQAALQEQILMAARRQLAGL